jgi:hypothetical protein
MHYTQRIAPQSYLAAGNPFTHSREFAMSKITRRTMIQSAAASTAFGAFTIAGTKSSAKVLGANDRIRVGVAGIHGRGGGHIGEFAKMDNVEVAYIIDPDSRLFGGRIRQVESTGGNKPTAVQDIRRALEDNELNAVSVATCNHWHSLITVWACQAGKDVYVEKPCSQNVFEGRQCVEAARKYKRIVQHGTQRRSGGAGKRLRDNAAGKSGKLTHIRGYSPKGRGGIGRKDTKSPPAELDFNIWLGPAPDQPYHENLVHYNWHWFWDTGNGDIGNYGVHEMDECRWQIPNATLPRRITSFGGRFKWNDQGQTPNLQMAVYDYGDVKLIFEVSNLKFDRSRPKAVYDKDATVEPIEIQYSEDVKNPTADRGPGGGIFKNFIACVRSRRSQDLDAHIEEGHYSASLCHLANISYRLGQPAGFANKPAELGDDPEVDATWRTFVETAKNNGVDVRKDTFTLGRTLNFDPATERFVDNKDANLLLTRPYRSPFVVPAKV